MNQTAKRTVSALAVAALAACAILYLPTKVLLPAMIVLTACVHAEFTRLVSLKYPIMAFPGVAAGLLWSAAAVYAPHADNTLVVIVFMLALVAVFGKNKNPVAALSTTVLGVIYIPVFLSSMLVIAKDFGPRFFLYVIAIVKLSDMGGFAFGKAFGRHRMCPSISPKKSWEGMAGSVFASCLISCAFMPLTHFTWPVAVGFGFAAAVLGTLGDLVESGIKREIGVKDSSVFLPAGMGGLLDMFDSLVFAPALMLPALRIFAA